MTAIIQPLLPKLILVHGLKESGKSTLADHLVETYGYTRVKMAGPLKNMLRSLLRDGGVAEDQIERHVEGDLKEVPIPQMSGRTARQLMQTLGDEWRRMQADDFWIDIAVGKIDQVLGDGGRVVVDDIRYENEFCRFAVYNPLTLVTTRGERHFAPLTKDAHPGERGLPVTMFHAHIANDYDTKQELWNVVDGIVDAWSSYRSSLAALAVKPGFVPLAA
jgi:predicted kinase